MYKHFQESKFDNSIDSPTERSKPQLSFDQTLTNIGFGKYQLKAYLILGLILLFDGSEAIVLSLVQNILKKEWGITPAENNFIGTAVFSGFLLGSLVSGRISDLYGRKTPLLLLTPALYITAIASSFANSYVIFLITRAVYGILVGIQFPICFTYLTEITPKETRGKYLIIAGSFFTVGELFTCGAAFFTLEGVSAGNWRLLLFCVAQPALICYLGLRYFIDESPRYLLVVKREPWKSAEILEKMANQNNAGLLLREEDIKGMAKWVEVNQSLQVQETGNFIALFSKRNRIITLFIWPVWFVLCLSYYGIIYILPQLIDALGLYDKHDDKENTLWSLTLPCLGELPSVVVGYLVIERASIGRKKSMIFGFLIAFIFCLLVMTTPFVNYWITAARMTLNTVWIIASPYTSELYPTNLRATGLGMASAFSRIGGAGSTWFSQILFDQGPKLPFAGFGGLCLVGAVCCSLIPYDTTQKELDLSHDNAKTDDSSPENKE